MKYSKMIYKMIQNVDKGKGVEFPKGTIKIDQSRRLFTIGI